MTRRRQNTRRALLSLFCACLVAALVPTVPVRAADPVKVSFASTGAEESWVVPAGVTSIDVVLVGGSGGAGENGPAGGAGHRVEGTLAVEPGDTLFLNVGGNGGTAGLVPGCIPGAAAFNGGAAGGSGLGELPGIGTSCGWDAGGGGGATDIRSESRADPTTLGSRLIIAAGGGGGGGGAGSGGGGSAESNGVSTGGSGGGAGTSTGGGSPGTGHAGGGNGADGAVGLGGNGGQGIRAGGGGGGGLYGGGGGGASNNGSGAGGGGGSSFVGSAIGTSIALDTTAIPMISIEYNADPEATPDPTSGPDQGTVDATISMAESSICIELSTATVDFGTGQFGQVDVSGSPGIVVTNCGITTQALYARGTDATASGASWDLVNDSSTCADTLGLDAYHLRLIDGETLDDEWGLGLTNTLLQSLDVNSTAGYGSLIDTACPGSSGAGLQMSMQIVFTATESVP